MTCKEIKKRVREAIGFSTIYDEPAPCTCDFYCDGHSRREEEKIGMIIENTNMNKRLNYEMLKQVIQKANPDREFEYRWDCGECGQSGKIRLADVLIAIQKLNINGDIIVAQNGVFYCKEYRFGHHYPNKFGEPIKWNFFKDNLDNQSEETKLFLFNLLVVCPE